jgi:hypothetical protein
MQHAEARPAQPLNVASVTLLQHQVSLHTSSTRPCTLLWERPDEQKSKRMLRDCWCLDRNVLSKFADVSRCDHAEENLLQSGFSCWSVLPVS